jgi:hypothetical protein
MQEQEAVKPSSGPWASPVVLIPKPDGSIRFCVDYRRLYAVNRKECYALPRVDDNLDSLGGAQYFSTFDDNSGYWKIAVATGINTRRLSPRTEGFLDSSVFLLDWFLHLQPSSGR